MRTTTTLAAIVLFAASVGAHAPDEFVQSLQVAVSPDRIVLHLGLTPGADIAAGVIARIDANGDGRISPVEAADYGRAVLGDLSVDVDGTPRQPALTRVEVPTVGELGSGEGTIRLETVVTAAGAPGRHVLVVGNTHAPEQSVYLANVLLPEQDAVNILRQSRDLRQQVFRLDYSIEPARTSTLMWGGAGAALLLGPLVFSRRRRRWNPI